MGQAWTQGSSASYRGAGEAGKNLCNSVTGLLFGGKVVTVGGRQVTSWRTLGGCTILVLFLELIASCLDPGADPGGQAVGDLAL